jgi:hypothetical protein
MTLTFNRDRYKDLLSEYQPKLIKTETEVVEDVMAGRLRIDRSMSESLGRLFHVDSMLFI